MVGHFIFPGFLSAKKDGWLSLYFLGFNQQTRMVGYLIFPGFLSANKDGWFSHIFWDLISKQGWMVISYSLGFNQQTSKLTELD